MTQTALDDNEFKIWLDGYGKGFRSLTPEYRRLTNLLLGRVEELNKLVIALEQRIADLKAHPTLSTPSLEQGYHDALNAKNECTLRDQLAMAALTGYCLRPYDAKAEGGMGGLFMARAQLAYEHADAMLEVRKRESTHDT